MQRGEEPYKRVTGGLSMSQGRILIQTLFGVGIVTSILTVCGLFTK